jgi:hypothetical protein
MLKALKETFGYDVKTSLEYRASRDGWNATDYHRFCDKKGPLISLIMTTNNVLCGGFLKIIKPPIKKEIIETGFIYIVSKYYDEHCFLFSLKTLKKYPVVDSNQATTTGINLGPWFGGTEG